MDTILYRIRDLAINEGITIGFLEKQIGASKGVLSRAIKNGSDIQSKWLQLIIDNYPQYSSSWLLTGNGQMILIDSLFETKSEHDKQCQKCKQNEQRITDLLETIASLKETNAIQKELITMLKLRN